MTKKFSQFVEDTVIQQTDIVVGLRSGVNTQFNFPGDGIADQYGNWIVKWQPYNSVDRNYILFTGSPQGVPVSMVAQGVDADLALVVSSKNNGNLNLISPNAGNINLSIGGPGNVKVSTNAGLFYINNTTGINAVLNENNMASNSATAVPTQQSVKTYVDNAVTIGGDETFITNKDETGTLPNSQPLSALSTGIVAVTTTTGILSSVILTGTANQVTVTGGTGSTTPTFSLPSTLIAPGTFQATTSLNIGGSGATVTSISTDGTLSANSDTLLVTEKAVKTYVDATASTGLQTFVTNTNETATLPNSQSLSALSTGIVSVTTTTGILSSVTLTGTSNQITVANGTGAGTPTFSLSSTLVTPGSVQVGSTLNIGGSGATVTSISIDGTMASNSDSLLSSQKAIKTYVDTTESAIKSYSYITKTDNTTNLPNSIPLSGIGTGFLANTTTTGVLTPRTMTGTANQISVANGDGSGVPTFSLPSTLIAPGTFQASTSLNVGGSGATITSISIDGALAGNSDALLSTQKATKTYIDTTESAIKSYSYITKTDDTANLPNSIALSSLGSGFLSNTTATGVLNPRTHTGTSNQIDISNGNGVLGNPTYTLSSTMVAPGTLNVTTTFTVGATVSVDSISNSASASSATQLMTANATQMAIANQISGAKSFRGGYNASTNLFPSTGGSGIAGAIQAGDVWEITVAGTLGGTNVYVGNTILALTNVPGQTAANWAISVTGVSSFNSRVGIVAPTSGDYSFSLISGTAAVAQGGTANTSVGSAGTFAYSDGSKYVFSPMTVPITAGSSGTYWRSNGTNVLSSTIQVADVPTLNQNTTGQAGSVVNSATFNNGGSGAASGATYNGGSAVTISYNTIGASPLTGSSSIVTVGTVTSGTWNATTIGVAYGGTGNTAVGANGTLAQSDGSKYTFTTATYPGTSTSGKLLRGDGTNWVPTTASYPDSLGANTILYGSSLNVVGAFTAGSAAVLTCNNGGGLAWKTLTDGQIVIGSTAGSPNSATLTAGTGITITNASNSITIAATGGGGGLTFNTVTTSTQSMAINNIYYSTYAGTCVMTLPSTAAVGSIVQGITDSSHLIQIAQNSGQLIYCGAQNGVSLVTTTGVGGSITTISPNTVITLMCIVANTTWEVIYTNNSYSGV